MRIGIQPSLKDWLFDPCLETALFSPGSSPQMLYDTPPLKKKKKKKKDLESFFNFHRVISRQSEMTGRFSCYLRYYRTQQRKKMTK